MQLELKAHMDLQDWMPISGVKSYVIQPLATHQMICHAVALLARMLCSEELVDSKSIDRLVAGQLIPFDKSPGVRPFGVGEVLRQIIGNAILAVLKSVLK